MAGVQRGLALLNLKKQMARQFSTSHKVLGGHGPPAHGGEVSMEPIKVKIGKREVVGFGANGEENYIDHVHYPFPAIRFKEDSGEILKLREKEKGDWKKMTVEEKKMLYRASFCSTISEFTAPSGEFKGLVGLALVGVTVGIWWYMWLKYYVYDPLPRTITDEEYQKATIQRMIDMEASPISGIGSKYDYEKNEWKK
jgi:cytochrome c oxidase subunit 4